MPVPRRSEEDVRAAQEATQRELERRSIGVQQMPSRVTQLGAGSSSGGDGTAAAQAAALRTPPPITADTPVNPMQSRAFDAASRYESGLAEGTNDEITRALGRERDEISVGLAKEGEAAISRGADPSLFRGRVLEGGRRSLNALQGKLTDVALGRREGAIGALTTAAGGAASEQRLLHLGTIGAGLESQRVQNETAETQARLYEQPYDRMLRTMDAVGRNRGNYDFGITRRSGGITGRSGGITSHNTSLGGR